MSDARRSRCAAARTKATSPVAQWFLGPKHPAIRYAFAVVTAALVTELTFELSALIGSRPSPQFLLAILIVAWIAGFGPAVVTWALSVAAINYLFVPPPYTVSFLVKEELVGLPIFSAVALVMAWLAATRRSVETARKALLARAQEARTEAERAFRSGSCCRRRRGRNRTGHRCGPA